MGTNAKTFSVHLANGKPKPRLVKFFLENIEIKRGQNFITLEDGSEWPLYKEPSLRQALRQSKDGSAAALVSFQLFTDGEFFAIGRLYQPKKAKAEGI